MCVRHGLAGLSDLDVSYVIASPGKMADAMDFSVRWAQRLRGKPIAPYHDASCGELGY
jgi:hypothetical protein